ncbi:MAG: chemotaxis protein CheB [Myxococcaceae bacterium]|nr:chemotaxis protein CheB [Myxococcaceae bacterium]MCA3012583.1 chemotaxis protein CheB [Myxococcaceae bacterium]
MTTKVKVLVAESTPLLAPRLGPLFGRRLERVGEAVTPERLVAAIREHQPGVALLRVDGASPALERAVVATMAEAPLPLLLMAGPGAPRQAALALLSAGALDVLPLPTVLDEPTVASLERSVVLLSTVAVVEHPRGRRAQPKGPAPGARPEHPVVAIAASLGGPRAIGAVLSGLPRRFGAPICVCQHITAGFTEDLTRWLTAETGHVVSEARDGAVMTPGRVYVAPSDVHLTLTAEGTTRLESRDPVRGFRPSCDVLLEGAAEAFGRRAIGVVLTGMGHDGARGLGEIRRRGGHTIAQDEQSSVVWGMPGEAVAFGAAEVVLPLEQIAAQLIKWVPGR